MTHKHAPTMPDTLWVIDREYEQRYYRSATSLAQAINDGFYTPGKDAVHAYRRTREHARGCFPEGEIEALMNARQPARDRVMGARAGKPKDSAEDKMMRAFEAQTRKMLAEILRQANSDN